jgi:hypothetical protein
MAETKTNDLEFPSSQPLSALSRWNWLLQWLTLVAILSLKLILKENMVSNECAVLPPARHFADPSWVAGDWFLSQPAGYRIFFDWCFGGWIATWGFLTTSIVGRLICYAISAAGLLAIGKRIGLSASVLFCAVVIFLHTGNHGMSAGESVLGDFEAKTVAYGFILLAIGLMLRGAYVWMAVAAGVATSFHVLVGGWTFLAMLASLILPWNRAQHTLRRFFCILTAYLLASAWALKPIYEQVHYSLNSQALSTSYIYVFLRLSHHLNPLSWSVSRSLAPIPYVCLFGLAIAYLRHRRLESSATKTEYAACMRLAKFAIWTMAPFVCGLLIARFDHQGRWLQYYLFRAGDVMLPLCTILLCGAVMQDVIRRANGHYMQACCLVVLSILVAVGGAEFVRQASELGGFPSRQTGIDLDEKDVCLWIREHTLPNAVVITPPVKLSCFTWLAERPTVAKYKLMAQTKAEILGWYERMADLSGHPKSWSTAGGKRMSTRAWQVVLSEGYERLTTAEVKALFAKYGGEYFITHTGHGLELPVVYRNSTHVVYSAREPAERH